MGKSAIVGWAHSAFGKLEDADIEALMGRVVRQALDHASVDPGDVDFVSVGVFNGGFCRQGFEGSLPALIEPRLRHAPAVRVENACATGSAAVHAALDFIESGRGRVALIVGAEKMTATKGGALADVLLAASYRKEEENPAGFAGIFGGVCRNYFDLYGDRREELAMIAAKNHQNGLNNPFAHSKQGLTFDFCNTVSDGNPLVAPPLRRTDCSLVSDGAAALVVVDSEIARSLPRAIGFRARTRVNDFLPLSRRGAWPFDGARLAWNDAYDAAGCKLRDLDFVETHDCFTIAEMIEYEAMGLAKAGEGWKVVRDGTTRMDGKLPVNPSGGLKSKGHPIGATGVSMHVLSAMQLCGEAGEMQIQGATLAGVFNMGGVAVTNYVSIMERIV